MKKTLLTMVAVLALMAGGTAANAWTAGSTWHGSHALDPHGFAVVSVHSPSSPLSVASHERIYLDSSGLWAVNDVKSFGYHEGIASGKAMTEPSRLYCFDSVNRFCAVAY
ncbi:MAG TPA: hypothetical protein VJM83_04435 [Nitrospirota bacterium]|nr:hypothetical protein [Nitrospirota bacterium]